MPSKHWNSQRSVGRGGLAELIQNRLSRRRQLLPHQCLGELVHDTVLAWVLVERRSRPMNYWPWGTDKLQAPTEIGSTRLLLSCHFQANSTVLQS